MVRWNIHKCLFLTCLLVQIHPGLRVAGHAEDTSTFFPIGIYGVRSAEDLEVVHQAGFNCVVGSSSTSFLDKAHTLGIRVIASPGSAVRNSLNKKESSLQFKLADEHPAFLSWYLIDEPDLHRVPPWKVAMDQRLLKTLPARSPVSVVLYNGSNTFDYGDIPDILMVDHYPVPWTPLSHFAERMKNARHSLPKEKPAYAVIQAFDWEYFRELLPNETEFRAPTLEELQCMTFMALAQGMDGIIYYTLRARDWYLPKHPDLWNGLQQVIDQVKENDFLLSAKRLWWLPKHQITPYKLRNNAALDRSISMTLFQDKNGIKHVLLINTTAHALDLKLRLPESENRWSSVFQGDTPFGGFRSEVIYDIPFEPYQVRLLKGFETASFVLP